MHAPDFPTIRLVALDDGPDIVLGRPLVVLGRHPRCDVRLDSSRVSRLHCCLTAHGGDLVVRDLDSTNGIRINGRRAAAGRLRPGDELAIAHLRFRVEGPAGSREIPTVLPRQAGESGGQPRAARLQSISSPRRGEAGDAAPPP
jgi:pSer/pThr/pTyr-binding forkhead associated (FHA) protein